MFKGDSADTCAEKFPLVSMGGRADTSSVHRRGARTPIGASGNLKRVDTNLKAKEAPTKSKLELQIKHLLQTNDALEESLRKKIELLESFEGKINNLENQIDYLSSKDIMFCKETQTEACLQSKCEECNFEGETDI